MKAERRVGLKAERRAAGGVEGGETNRFLKRAGVERERERKEVTAG